MNENNTIKDLESQARNTKRLMDKLNQAAYGMTFDEALRLRPSDPNSNHDHQEKEDPNV